MRRYYGVRLRDLVTGDLTHRELLAYIRHLPQDSAVGRALLGPAADYDATMHRLTDLLDAVVEGNWIAARAAGGKPKKPKPVKRPKPPQADI
uniref:Uncharacterized protein n=1 Tax=Thermocrispum agreste TaxID=37925 RepID=A0A2W4JS36_9PSEU|nr:MAG: hypothetical protein DIU77_03440 [Thermocrispum agreste]